MFAHLCERLFGLRTYFSQKLDSALRLLRIRLDDLIQFVGRCGDVVVNRRQGPEQIFS